MDSRSGWAVDYSIVIPVYYNEGSLRATMHNLRQEVLAKNPHLRGEVIFVDDGSGDRSYQVLCEIHAENPDVVRLIKLTRNFGQVFALQAGYRAAEGHCLISMSADGQDPVSLINDMLRAHFQDGHEVVICMREGRDESWLRIATSRIFYWLMRKLCFANMPLGGFDFLLLGRRPLDIILREQEVRPFPQGQILWTGFPPKFIGYRRRARTAGKSRWNFGKKLTYLLDGIMAYTFLPIRAMSLAGILLALLGACYAVLIFVVKLLGGIPNQGWAPIMIVMLVTSGTQLLMMGLLGEYIWRSLEQVRNRATYIIEETRDRRREASPSDAAQRPAA